MNKLEIKEYCFDYLINKLNDRGFDNIWINDEILNKIIIHNMLFTCCVASNKLKKQGLPSLFIVFDEWYALPWGCSENYLDLFFKEKDYKKRDIKKTFEEYELNIFLYTIDQSISLIEKHIPQLKTIMYGDMIDYSRNYCSYSTTYNNARNMGNRCGIINKELLLLEDIITDIKITKVFKKTENKTQIKEYCFDYLVYKLNKIGLKYLWVGVDDFALSKIISHSMLFICCLASNHLKKTRLFNIFDDWRALPYGMVEKDIRSYESKFSYEKLNRNTIDMLNFTIDEYKCYLDEIDDAIHFIEDNIPAIKELAHSEFIQHIHKYTAWNKTYTDNLTKGIKAGKVDNNLLNETMIIMEDIKQIEPPKPPPARIIREGRSPIRMDVNDLPKQYDWSPIIITSVILITIILTIFLI